MAYWNDADIPALIAGAGGVVVIHSTGTTQGLLDTPDEHLLPGANAAQIAAHRLLTVQTSAISPKSGDQITVDGTLYHITDRLRKGDGATTQMIIKLGA